MSSYCHPMMFFTRPCALFYHPTIIIQSPTEHGSTCALDPVKLKRQFSNRKW